MKYSERRIRDVVSMGRNELDRKGFHRAIDDELDQIAACEKAAVVARAASFSVKTKVIELEIWRGSKEDTWFVRFPWLPKDYGVTMLTNDVRQYVGDDFPPKGR